MIVFRRTEMVGCCSARALEGDCEYVRSQARELFASDLCFYRHTTTSRIVIHNATHSMGQWFNMVHEEPATEENLVRQQHYFCPVPTPSAYRFTIAQRCHDRMTS